ncbi:MAG: hypothetical protein O7E52_16350 [Candidatus Poribacteria bacterium]|nr:hypothetical protein [Candidatus Poribacteria bacterium]
MPVARGTFGTAIFSGRIFIFGGVTGFNDDGNDEVLKSVDVYDPATDTWLVDEATPMKVARSEVTTVVARNKIYVIGGLSAIQSFRSNFEYEPGGLSVSPQGKLATRWAEIKQRSEVMR